MIIFLFGRAGSGKSSIVQNLIPRIGRGEEIDVITFFRILDAGGYKKTNRPIFIVSGTLTRLQRDGFRERMWEYKGLTEKTFYIFVDASEETCKLRLPKTSFKAPRFVEPICICKDTPEADKEYDLRLDTEKSDVISNAGFLGLFLQSRS